MSSSFWAMQAARLRDEEKYEAAVECYCQALKFDPSDRGTWYNQGTLLFNLEQYAEAIVSYDRAIRLALNQLLQEDQVVYYAWNNEGRALANLGQYEQAIASIDKAIELIPHWGLAWENKANLLECLGQYEDALTSIDKALEVGVDDPYSEYQVWEQRAKLCSYLKLYDD